MQSVFCDQSTAAFASIGVVCVPLTPCPSCSSSNVLRFSSEFVGAGPRLESPYALSPVGATGPHGMTPPSSRKATRKIARSPFKVTCECSPNLRRRSPPAFGSGLTPPLASQVLDAPQLQDDFYLNLVRSPGGPSPLCTARRMFLIPPPPPRLPRSQVDWSAHNVLAVGLGTCVYMWSACTSKVTKLCDLAPGGDSVASVGWTQRGAFLAVGTTLGEVQIWDAAKCKRVRTMGGHRQRVGVLAWSSHVLSSGGRDKSIFQRDVRAPEDFVARLVGHRSEVCGLKWSADERELASGGNDNLLLVWNGHSTSPALRFSEHGAAVKAIAWSPHQSGLLASGGGTADRCVRFWNTATSAALQSVDTGSQVCNLAWSKNVNEIVSTHGYSQNQIVVWRYPGMSKLATLTGHTLRVLYLAVSPDGQSVVTGAGDETLRFWNVFPGTAPAGGFQDSLLQGRTIR